MKSKREPKRTGPSSGHNSEVSTETLNDCGQSNEQDKNKVQVEGNPITETCASSFLPIVRF